METYTLKIDTVKYVCLVKKSTRSRRVKLEIDAQNRLTLTVPSRIQNIEKVIDTFVLPRSDWILRATEKNKLKRVLDIGSSRKDYSKYKDLAYTIISQKVNYWNQWYGFEYQSISIKNQKTRWGSCSSQGNLNFNFRCIFLREEELDYIVVHELCHLRELNHGKNFWKLVEYALPEYERIEDSLKHVAFD